MCAACLCISCCSLKAKEERAALALKRQQALEALEHTRAAQELQLRCVRALAEAGRLVSGAECERERDCEKVLACARERGKGVTSAARI